jgi:hypothetical protein
MDDHLPGGDILRAGLRDLRAGARTVNALLVLVAAPRLSRCGVLLPAVDPPNHLPEHDLYRLLRAEHGPEAYRHYRSLMRRLVSLEQALELTSAP